MSKGTVVCAVAEALVRYMDGNGLQTLSVTAKELKQLINSDLKNDVERNYISPFLKKRHMSPNTRYGLKVGCIKQRGRSNLYVISRVTTAYKKKQEAVT